MTKLTTNTSTLDTGGWALVFFIAVYVTHAFSRHKMEDSKIFQSLPDALWVKSRYLWLAWCLGRFFAGIAILAILLNRHAFAINSHGLLRDMDVHDGTYVTKLGALSFLTLYLMQRFPDVVVMADWWVTGGPVGSKRVAPSTSDLRTTYYTNNKWGRIVIAGYVVLILAVALAVLGLLGKQFIVNIPFQTAMAFWTLYTAVIILKVIVVGCAVIPKHTTT